MTIDDLQIEINAKATKANDAVDRLVAKLDRLTTSLGRVEGTNLNGLANGVQHLGNAMQTMNGVKTAEFTSLATNLSKLNALDTSKLTNLAVNVNHISTSLRGLTTVSEASKQMVELANGIKQLGYKSADKAVNNIPKLASAMRQLMTELSKAPVVNRSIIDMTNALAKLARTGASSGKAAQSLGKSLNIYSASASNATKKTFSLASAFGKMYATYWLLFRAFGKLGDAIDLSSNLTEVQNVVDVTFGEYSRLIDQMSETSITDFGMSELTVKQVSSRFQAMGTAMGFAQGNMADMSVELTKLTADMASFYNVEQKDVAEDLESIFTGQTRPLRTYGLDLTEATLKEWAMKQGMDANIDSMSQIEKTMLRYNYVMANTGAAQGDFLRTQDTWANQVRILKQNLEQLAIIIGGNLINALKPLVKALNAAMEKVIAFAKVVSDSLGKIFGWKYEEGSGGFASEFEDAADATDDLASGTGKVAKNVEKINKGIRAFDELKVINLPEPTTPSKGGSGGGGGIGGGDATGAAGQWVKDTEDAFYESDLDTLYKLGDYISQSLSRAMESVDWDAVYAKARNFGSGLASFLNGLISPRLFGNVGRTIASSLNTAIYATLSFGETFDWQDFGDSIAEGINDFFKTFDFGALAQTLNVWVDGIIKLVGTAIKETDKGAIVDGFKEFFDEIELDTVGVIIGAITIKKFGKLAWGFALGTVLKPLALTFLSSLGATLTADVGAVFSAGTFGGIAATIGTGILGALAAWFVGQEIGKFIGRLLFPEDASWYEEFTWFGEEGFFQTIFGDIESGEDWIYTHITEPLDVFRLMLEDMGLDVTRISSEFSKGFKESLEETKQKFISFGKDLSSWFTNDVKPWFTKEKWFELASGIKSGVSEKWNEFLSWWKTAGIYQWYEQHIKPWFSKEKWSFDGIKQGLQEGFNNAIEGAKQIWNSFANWLNQYLVWNIPDFQLGNMTFEGGTIVLGQLPTFETGGFPEDGLFMANHGELVGQFSNGKTAVANNAQIVEGIKAGVYDAVVSAMRDTRGNGGTVRVVGDSQGIFNLVREAADEYFETTGEPAFTF